MWVALKRTWHKLPKIMRTGVLICSSSLMCMSKTSAERSWSKINLCLTNNKRIWRLYMVKLVWNSRSNIRVTGRRNSQIRESPSFKGEIWVVRELDGEKKEQHRPRKMKNRGRYCEKSTKFVIVPPFGDPALNSIQKLVRFFEQIVDMPQNRGCLSWDEV